MVSREQIVHQADDWTPPPPVPYVWGGSSRQGADCSGFVVAVLRELSAPFPQGVRTAEQIRQSCAQVSPHDAKPGDLVFFEKTYDNPQEIDRWGPDGKIATHIGFAVDWGYPTRMLDTHEWVHYTTFNSYWNQKFLGVARPPQIDEEGEGPEDMEYINTFISNALAPDGEIMTALHEIDRNMLESDVESAQQNIHALADRVDTLWNQWKGN
jgi:hypothetical protein